MIEYSVNNKTENKEEADSDFLTVKNSVFESQKIKRHLTSAPTYTPKNASEQFAFYDDGVDKKLYAYINGVWKEIGVAAASAQYASGNDTRTVTGAGTQVITTGFEPKLIRITAVAYSADGGQSWGTGTGTSAFRCAYKYLDGNWLGGVSTSYIILVYGSGGLTAGFATLSAIGSTSFTLSWGACSVITNFVWEAYG